MPLGWWLGWGLVLACSILVVIVEGEEADLGGESLGLSNVTSGIICVRVDDTALPKLLWVFSCYIDKAHCAVIFAIAQLSCLE